MSPYRLVALVIIALFALGYARLLIDAGVRDEAPQDNVALDLVTRAACTAIAEPLGEVLEVDVVPQPVVLPDGEVGCSITAPPSDATAAELRARTERLFRYLQWTRVASPAPETVTFFRRPIRCDSRFDARLEIVCKKDDEL